MVIEHTYEHAALATCNAIVLHEQQLYAEGVKELLVKTNKFNLVTSFLSADEVYNELQSNCYGYLFVDMVLQGVDVKSYIQTVRKKWPELIIIVVTPLMDLYSIKAAFTAGANSYVSTYVGASEFENAIDKNVKGEKYISSDLVSKFVVCAVGGSSEGNLTKREMEIIGFVAKGYSIAKTASEMHLSQHTIVTHRRNIMQKLKIHSAVEVTRYAIANGFVLV